MARAPRAGRARRLKAGEPHEHWILFARQQEALGQRQNVLAKQQDALGREQERAQAELDVELGKLIDGALAKKLAQPVP